MDPTPIKIYFPCPHTVFYTKDQFRYCFPSSSRSFTTPLLRFPIKISYAPLTSLMRVTSSYHLFFLHLVTLILTSKKCNHRFPN